MRGTAKRRLRTRLAAAVLPGLFLAGPGHAIVSGRPVDDAEFAARMPWAVVIVSRDSKGICTGSLISPRFVLTAAHCAGGAGKDVMFGDPSRGSMRRVAVRAAILHPRFVGQTMQYDLALLRLVRPVRVAPVAVVTRAESFGLLRANDEVAILGWGASPGQGTQPDRLRRAVLRLDGVGTVGTHIALAAESGGPCGGDSGGPLLVSGNDGRALLVGVASVTDGNLCATGGGSSGYTNVALLRQFIQEHVPDLPERPPPLEFSHPDGPRRAP